MTTPESGDKSPDRITTKRSGSSSVNDVGELSSELGKLTLSVLGPGLYVATRPLLLLLLPLLGLMSGKKSDGKEGFNATWTRRFKLSCPPLL
jgi:hypothetical protein